MSTNRSPSDYQRQQDNHPTEMDVPAKSIQTAAYLTEHDYLLTPTMPAIPRLRFRYSDYQTFFEIVTQHLDALKQRKTFEFYIEFTHVSPAQFQSLSSSERPSKSIRFSYDDQERTLVLKMPGDDHEDTTGLFRELVADELSSMNIKKRCLIVSSPRVTIGRLTKEPDTCWGPKGTGDRKVVMEVGVSETARELGIDARNWIESTTNTIEAVITICVGNYHDDSVVEKPLAINVYVASPALSRHQPFVPHRTFSVVMARQSGSPNHTFSGISYDITGAQAPTNQIGISADLFIDGGPGGQVVLTRQMLLEFAEDLWKEQRQRR